MVYGFHPIRELLRSQPHRVKELWIGRDRRSKRRAEVEAHAERHSIAIRAVAEGELSGLAEGAHNGFGALVADDGAVGDSAGDPNLLVLLEDIQDPRNLGALLRVCEGAGVGRVLARDRGTAPLSEFAVRTAAGAASWIPVERVTNSAQTLAKLKSEGFWVYGAAMEGKSVWDVDLSGKAVICLGGEENGLRAHTREHCDELISLPMQGKVESLNVATAASAILFEAVRQRLSLSASQPDS